jgi:phospholipase/carboxylesterase
MIESPHHPEPVMNRIKISPLAFVQSKTEQPQRNTDTHIEHAVFSPAESDLSYGSFVPVHYESGYSYPLIVWLETSGQSDSYSMLNAMPLVSARNYIGVSITVPGRLRKEIDQSNLLAGNSLDCVVRRAIDQIACKYNIAEHRIYIAGCGSAGSTAFKIGLRNCELFAGVASLGGCFPEQDNVLIQWSASRTMPLFWTQDMKSRTFPESLLCEQLKMLFTAGFDVTLRQYPGNAPSPRTLSDLNVWIMDQINGTDDSCRCCEEL